MVGVLLMISWLIGGTVAACPPQCHCGPDSRGRKTVFCPGGSMSGPVPVSLMDSDIEIMRITAPEDQENCLTMGPIFQGFQKLEEVHITHSNVPAIGKHSFWGVPSLKLLNLTSNNISQVLDNNFRGLVNLLELHLDWNRIESMGSGTFQHLHELRVLSLRGNRIHQLSPRLFLKLAKLRFLDLSDNDLEHLDPEVFKDVQELRTFSCRRCNLRNMNPHIYSLLSNLAHLDLGENQFKYLDREEFRDLKKLMSLRLDGNHFPVVLEGTFASQGRLQYLNLARSHIAKVTNHAFDNLTSLLELDLSYNKLDRLEPITFQPLAPHLRSLLVSGNNIKVDQFLYVLQVTTRLKELALADLPVKNGLPIGLVAHLGSLKHLNLSGNELTRFHYQLLTPVPGLSSLDLSRNKLHSLDEGSVVKIDSIPKVFLQDNPWVCDLCHILPMIRSNGTWKSSVICSLPNQLQGRTLSSLTSDQLSLCSGGLDYKEEGFVGLALTHKTQLGLIAAGFAIALLVITMASVIVGFFYNRKNTSYYYSEEEKVKATEEICNGFGTETKLPVCTTDDVPKDPEEEEEAEDS